MKIVIYKTNGNNINIFSPAENLPLEVAISKGIPKDVFYIVKDNSFIDYVFLNAYKFENENIIIDYTKAKSIWLDKFRSARTPILQKLDVDFMKAVETANVELQQEIAAKKQALRDVTKTELPDTLEGIKNTWPEILGDKPF